MAQDQGTCVAQPVRNSQVEDQMKAIDLAVCRLTGANEVIGPRLRLVLVEAPPSSKEDNPCTALVPLASELQRIAERINEQASIIEDYTNRLEL